MALDLTSFTTLKAEQRDAVAAFSEQAMAMFGEQAEIRGQVGIQRRGCGAIDAGNGKAHDDAFCLPASFFA